MDNTELVNTFEKLADKFGPDVIAAARGAAITDAYSWLVSSIIWLIIGVALIYFGYKVWSLNWIEPDLEWNWAKVTSVFLIIAGGFIVTINVTQLVDPWLWVPMKNPDFYIAKKVIGF